jgi:cytochrome c553
MAPIPVRLKSMRLPVLFALAASLLLCALAASAAEKPARLGLCASCHGENGHATASGTPNLAAQDLDYMRNAIKQYQSGARDVPVMRAATGMVNAAELEQVLAWYAQAPARETTTP